MTLGANQLGPYHVLDVGDVPMAGDTEIGEGHLKELLLPGTVGRVAKRTPGLLDRRVPDPAGHQGPVVALEAEQGRRGFQLVLKPRLVRVVAGQTVTQCDGDMDHLPLGLLVTVAAKAEG
jgi:hypothetical protein